MGLFHLTINLDRLAVAIESATPVLTRIADSLDRAFPPVRSTYPAQPAGPEQHFRVTDESLRAARQKEAARRNNPHQSPTG